MPRPHAEHPERPTDASRGEAVAEDEPAVCTASPEQLTKNKVLWEHFLSESGKQKAELKMR